MKKTKILLAMLSIGLSSLMGQDELDLDAMWDNTVWNEIEEVTTKEYEVEKVTTVAGDEVTFVGINTGAFFPVHVKKVWATGTSASNILALW